VNPTLLAFVALMLTVGSGVLWFRAASAVSLPENRTGFIGVWLGAFALGLAALAGGTGWIGGIAAVISIIGATFFLLTVAISRQVVSPDAISPGAMLPAFSALDDSGEKFDAVSLAGHPVLIKFFRGHW